MEQKDYDRAMVMNRTAQECLQKGDPQGALRNLKSALELLPTDKVEARARLHNNKGHIEVRLKVYDGALSSFRAAAQIYDKLGEQISLAEQFGNVGSVYREAEQWDSALENYSKSLAIFEATGHKKGIADQYSNLAYAHFCQNRLETALEFFRKSKALYGEIGEDTRSRLCDQNIQLLKSCLEKQQAI